MIFLCSEKLNKAHTATLPTPLLFLIFIVYYAKAFFILYFIF